MKYRFRVSEKHPAPPKESTLPRRLRRPRLKGSDTVRARRAESEPIEFSSLFELGALPEAMRASAPKRQKKKRLHKRHLSALWRHAKESLYVYFLIARAYGIVFYRRIRILCRTVAARRRANSEKKTINALPVLAGVLCAALLVSALSAAGVLISLLAPYHRSYVSVTVPDLVGQTPDALTDDRFNVILRYEQNPNVPDGLVIAQTPHAGVTRRIYDKDGRCEIVLTVSRDADAYRLEELVGMSERDASLTLTNHGVQIQLKKDTTSTAPAGTVLETTPVAGSELRRGETVVLRVSAGQPTAQISMPNLFGLSESEAIARLRAAGLTLGNVTYQSSPFAAGSVIAQNTPAYSAIKSGEAISFTVSAGEYLSIPTVPDLYGMTPEAAEARLKEYGLLIGSIYSVASAAPDGTVLAQNPLPGSPITSSTVSVDLTVAS